jgi:hypothetical protein
VKTNVQSTLKTACFFIFICLFIFPNPPALSQKKDGPLNPKATPKVDAFFQWLKNNEKGFLKCQIKKRDRKRGNHP